MHRGGGLLHIGPQGVIPHFKLRGRRRSENAILRRIAVGIALSKSVAIRKTPCRGFGFPVIYEGPRLALTRVFVEKPRLNLGTSN
jgi:hypothetical protein